MFAKLIAFLSLTSFGLSTQLAFANEPSPRAIIVSVPDQKLVILENGAPVAKYPVSTSRYGLGDRFGSYATPVGRMVVAEKVGEGAPLGAVFKSRQRTGEVLPPNAAGRDPIVTRILWLRGVDSGTRNAFDRKIYIHGTPVERLIGKPVSYGCIRMRSKDVVDVFNRVGVGAPVEVTTTPLRRR